MPVSVSIVVFQGIPEVIALAALVMSLGGKGFQWEIIFRIAMSQLLSLAVIRALVVTPGVHTILAMITLAIFAFWWAKMEMMKACQASAIAMATLVIVEMTILFLIDISGIFTLDQINDSEFLRTICVLLLALILFFLAFIVDRIKQSRKKIL